MANEEMTMLEMEQGAMNAAAEAAEAAQEAAKAKTKAGAEDAARRAAEAAAKAAELIERMEKAKAAMEAAPAVKANPAAEARRKRIEQAQELVSIRLFKDEDKYKDDVPVFVNGKRFLIQRGVDVEVPRYVAEIIAISQKQDSQTDLMMRRLSDEFEANTAEKTKTYGA